VQSKTELQEKFGIQDILRFEETPAGLVRAVVTTAQADADVYLQGAHVAHWAPKGQKPVVFVSSRSEFAPGKAIRGGIPVIFPWFGPRGGGLPGPSHGFARTALWRLYSAQETGGQVEIVFVLEPKDLADSFGYADFRLQLRVAIGTELQMELQVRNQSGRQLEYEEALHSYFGVGDIGQVSISGLEGTTYIDKTDGMKRKRARNEPLELTKETDQVHLNTTATCVVDDAMGQRRIVIEKSGSESTVVWNPWAEKTKSLKDMSPDEWREMVCVESANAADNAMTVAPGQEHLMRVVIRVEPRLGVHR
jgi:glucose-6-phosphate 1-epimerase